MKILLIDDDIDDQVFFQLSFKNIHNEVEITSAYNAEEAIEKLEAVNNFDLIFMDWHMPTKNGIQLLEEIRKISHYATVPIYILSTAEPVDMQLIMEKGGTGYFNMPMQSEDYQKMLAEIISKHHIELH